MVGDPLFHWPFNRVPDLAMPARLPSLYLDRDVVVVGGGLLSYGPNWEVINLKTARSLGVTMPQSLLLRADQLIE